MFGDTFSFKKMGRCVQTFDWYSAYTLFCLKKTYMDVIPLDDDIKGHLSQKMITYSIL